MEEESKHLPRMTEECIVQYSSKELVDSAKEFLKSPFDMIIKDSHLFVYISKTVLILKY